MHMFTYKPSDTQFIMEPRSVNQTQSAGRAVGVTLWIQAAGCVIKSSAAIFRLSSTIKNAQYSIEATDLWYYSEKTEARTKVYTR